jgi:tripartite-type tricarboxylate transporter receptor subunit TctC
VNRLVLLFGILCGWLAAGLAFSAQPPRSDDYPSRSIRLIVPSAPSGGTDLIGRLIAQKVSEAWGQQVVVENLSGGATTIGTQAVARSTPDGHTMLLTTVNFAFIPAIYPKLPYDPVNDFVPVIMVAAQSSMLTVHPGVPAESVAQLIALARKQPGQIRYGTGGNGSVGHLSTALFSSLAHVTLLQVAYKGTAPGITALMAGEIHMLISNIAAMLPHTKSGKLRALAVTSRARSRIVPELQTVAESGLPGYEYGGWYGLWVPAKTAQTVVMKINDEFNRALSDTSLRERFDNAGIEPGGGSSEKFASDLAGEFVKWRKVAHDANIKIE